MSSSYGVEHRRGPRLDDAVGVGLEDPDVQPRPAAEVARSRPRTASSVVDQSSSGLAGRICSASRVRSVRSPASRQRPPQRQFGHRRVGVLDGGDAGRVHRGDALAHRRRASRRPTARGMCRETSSCAPSLSAPVGSPVAGSRTMTPSRGSGVSRSMPASRRAALLTQAGVAVVAAHERRPVRHDRVELLRGSEGRPGTGRTSSRGP